MFEQCSDVVKYFPTEQTNIHIYNPTYKLLVYGCEQIVNKEIINKFWAGTKTCVFQTLVECFFLFLLNVKMLKVVRLYTSNIKNKKH